MSSFLQDARYAGRMLSHARGFTFVAVLVLAIGIGANAAMFTLVDAALIRPLPFPQPDRLVMLWEHSPTNAHNRVAPLNFLDWSEQNRAFSGMAAVAGAAASFAGSDGAAERIQGQAVTSAFFDVLGVVPIAGRTFTPDDARARVVVLSERFWRTRFGGDVATVGRTITLDGQPATVIGIVPESFQILYPSSYWTPYAVRRSPEQRRMHYTQVIGRLRDGVTIDDARRDMNRLADDIARISPETNRGWTVTVDPLRQALVGAELRSTSLVLAGVVAFVLLMASANVANLLLARGVGRTREIAVRAALGGTRARIVSQLLTESVILASLGGAAGLAVAWALVKAAPATLPAGTLPASLALTFDVRVAAFACALTLVAAVVFGLVPAWHASRVALAEALVAGSRTATRATGRFRAALATAEIAVAVLLVTGAGLLVRTLVALNAIDPGFHADRVLTMYVGLPMNRYTQERARIFYDDVEREIAALPGVRAVSFGGNLPLDGWTIGQGFEIEGAPAPDKANRPQAHYQIVGPRYFSVLGIPVLRGRPFTERDAPAAPPVCIVNEEFVRRYLPGRDPIGVRVSVQSMDMRGPTPVTREIVGVVRQVKVDGPGETEAAVEIYVPIAQNPWFTAAIVVQAATDPMALAPAVRAAIARVDKDQPVTRVRTMEGVAADAVAGPRFRARLLAGFAALALLLAGVGVFGVIAFTVNQRVREFGIRMALGADRRDVLRLVVASGARMTAAGVLIGIAAAAGLTRWLATLLFGVTPLDPLAFAAAPAVLACLALGASAVPALRAARVDPAVALRQD